MNIPQIENAQLQCGVMFAGRRRGSEYKSDFNSNADEPRRCKQQYVICGSKRVNAARGRGRKSVIGGKRAIRRTVLKVVEELFFKNLQIESGSERGEAGRCCSDI